MSVQLEEVRIRWVGDGPLGCLLEQFLRVLDDVLIKLVLAGDERDETRFRPPASAAGSLELYLVVVVVPVLR
ncbi:hypothetical protein JCM18237_26380 [Halorubrum luteum]